MCRKMGRNRILIFRDENTVFALGPKQNLGIVRAQRQIRRIANACNIQCQAAAEIVPADGMPEWSAEVLVQKKAYRHASRAFGVGIAARSTSRLQPLPQSCDVD